MKHILVPADAQLFASMVGKYKSDNERIFFEKMSYKQEYVLTISNDLILWEGDNEDRLYLVRCEYEEYILGCAASKEEVHTMSLYDALQTNLKKAGLLEKNITLWDWLRSRDYQGVDYEHNYDCL